jgi:hypothetical protein
MNFIRGRAARIDSISEKSTSWSSGSAITSKLDPFIVMPVSVSAVRRCFKSFPFGLFTKRLCMLAINASPAAPLVVASLLTCSRLISSRSQIETNTSPSKGVLGRSSIRFGFYTAAQVDYRLRMVREGFPELLSPCLCASGGGTADPDETDSQVAAIHEGAHVIVTSNHKHFLKRRWLPIAFLSNHQTTSDCRNLHRQEHRFLDFSTSVYDGV